MRRGLRPFWRLTTNRDTTKAAATPFNLSEAVSTTGVKILPKAGRELAQSGLDVPGEPFEVGRAHFSGDTFHMWSDAKSPKVARVSESR